MEIRVTDAEETIKLGEIIGKSLEPGSIIALRGDLGAGKTVLVKGIARGLDIEDEPVSPTFVIMNAYEGRIPLYHFDLYRLSDDIAFRFSERSWSEYPLTAQKFANWVSAINGNGEIVNLFLDYETFGEHQWEESGIFEFLRHLPKEILKNPDNNFITPSEAVEKYEARDEIDVPEFMSWADIERDLSAWTSNPMQADALKKLYELENLVFELGDSELLENWRTLTTSDHFYYMCTKWFSDGDVHKYFNPYETPYEAFISYMNVLTDLKLRAQNKAKAKLKPP